MAKSSISCTDDQRWEIVQIKKQYKELFGVEIRDKELVDLFLKAFKEKEAVFLGEVLERVANRLQEIAIDISDYEKLKQENEELRKQIEELKSREQQVKPPEDPKEAYNLFVKAILDRVPSDARKDVERSLRLFQFIIFSDGINIEILKRLGEWAEEMAYLIKFNKENKEDYETEMRGGVTLW